MTIGIQVKRYRRDNKVREKEIRDLFGSIVADNYDRGVMITTSSLTGAAKEYIKERRAVQDRISFVAGDQIAELLISYCKQELVPFWD